MSSRVVRSLVVALAVLALFEGVLRMLGPRLGEPQEWYNPYASTLVEMMDRLSAAGETGEIVVAGTSMVMSGIRVEALEAGLTSGLDVRNAGLQDAHTPVVHRWLLEQVVPRLEPRFVIWGLASLDFNGGRPIKSIDLYEAARAGKVGATGPLDRILSRLSMVARYREFLRGPLFFKNLFDPVPPDPGLPALGDLMWSSDFGEVQDLDFQTDDRFRALESSLLHDFRIGDREASDFVRTLGALRVHGIEVVVVLLPVPREYVDAHPGGGLEFDAFRRWVEEVAVAEGATVFDYSRSVPEDQFLDYNHVGPTGADTLTAMLVEDLKALGW